MVNAQAVSSASPENHAVYLVRFSSSIDTSDVKWPQKTYMDKLRREGHLSDIHVYTFNAIIEDIDKAQGNSGSVVSKYREYVDTSSTARSFGPMYCTNRAQDRFEAITVILTQEERRLLSDLLADFYGKKNGEHMLEVAKCLGRYKGVNQAQALLVGKITSMLNRLYEKYPK